VTVDARRLSPELMPLWRAVHERLSSGLPVSTVKVGPLDAEQQAALADLLGADKLPGEYTSVSLKKLDQALGEMGLVTREVVTQVIGPIGDRQAARRKAAAERDELRAWLVGHDVVRAQPALADWATGVRQRTREELEQALKVLQNLPANGVPLPVFADAVLGTAIKGADRVT
jgi:hypothetical protein